MCILKKVAQIQLELMGEKIPKTGYNKFNGNKYHELEDLLPVITKKCFEHELILLFDFPSYQQAVLRVTNWNDASDFVAFNVPIPVIEKMNSKMNIMQSEGSYITYLKRYLLINAFLIMERDVAEVLESDEPKKTRAPSHSTPKEEPPVNTECPHSIKMALKRIKSKGINPTKKTVFAHVNWKQISEVEKEAAKAWIDRMEES